MEKEKINNIDEFNKRANPTWTFKNGRIIEPGELTPNVNEFMDTSKFVDANPVVFIYYIDDSSGETFNEIRMVVEYVASPMFGINLIDIKPVRQKMKIIVTGEEKDLSALRHNLDNIFNYYNNNFDIKYPGEKT